MSWHASPGVLERYADGHVDPAQAASVEAHLLACDACRRTLALHTPQPLLDQAWDGIVEAVDSPRPRLFERLLRSVSVKDHVARVLAATASLQLSWLAAVAAALAFGVMAAHAPGGNLIVFLVLAPLLPVAGVAAAFGPGTDPSYEIVASAPMSSFRLLLIRAVTVLGTTVSLAGLASLALPGLGPLAAAWLLPALGLTAASLALATVVDPARAAGAVAAGWLLAVATSGVAGDDRFAAFRGTGQLAAASVLTVAVLVLASRRDALEIRSQL
jgi:hypothetical protein